VQYGVCYNNGITGTPLETLLANCLDGCAQACDATANCIAVTTDSLGDCTLYSSASLTPNTTLTSALQANPGSPPISNEDPGCSLYRDSNGPEYEICTNTTNPGTVLSTQSSDSNRQPFTFDSCCLLCDASTQCHALNVNAQGVCQLLVSFNNGGFRSVSGVTSGFKQQ
jgi:hypothetical protein